MKEPECDDVTLQDFVDGWLDAAQEGRVREHLAACARCRAEERQLRRLLARVAELPRTVAPPHDLWPGVAARLGGRRASPPAEVEAIERPRRARSWNVRRWVLQTAAAIVFTALGAALGRLIPDAGETTAAAVRPASSSAFAAAETEYLRAKDALWLVAASRRDELSPVTMEIVRRNLVLIDEAIWELRQALAADPGNPHLESLLLAQHRRGLDLLRRLSARSA